MSRLRENFLLKVVSLLASVLLYFYVQQERDPIITRPVSVTIKDEHRPPSADVELEYQQLPVNITGPRSAVDRVKDGDIAAIADLRELRADQPRTELVRLSYWFPTALRDVESQIGIDPTSPTVKVQVYPPKARELIVTALYPTDPPPGFKYGPVRVEPTHVKVVGRPELVDRVDQLIARAEPAEPGSQIDGDFKVSALDTDGNPVETGAGLTLEPSTVHVTVTLREAAYSKTVPVSPDITDLPAAPYRLTGVSVRPIQTKITGRPAAVDSIGTISTDAIHTQGLTANREIQVGLAIPPGVTVDGVNGKPVRTVTVHLEIGTPAPAPIRQNTPSSDHTGQAGANAP